MGLLRREGAAWLRSDATRSMRERSEEEVRDYARGKGYPTTSLDLLGTHELTRGTHQVLDGQPDGWQTIDLGLQLTCLSFRLRGEALLDRIAPVLAHALISGRELEAQKIGSIFVDLHARGHGHDGSWPFVELAVALWRLRSGQVVSAELGPYQSVWTQLREGTAVGFAAELVAVADLHLEGARDLGSNEPAFIFGYELLPVDVLWLLESRRRLGLEVPARVEHPLMALPTATPPEPWPRFELTGDLRDAFSRAAKDLRRDGR